MASPEQEHQGFDTSALLRAEAPLPNDDPDLKSFVAKRGRLYKNISVIAIRSAVPGEEIETWVKGSDDELLLERTTPANEGDLVAIGTLGEQYIPSRANVEKNREAVGPDGLRDDENAPPVPNDGHSYTLYRTNGQDFRLATPNPFNDQYIYLRTSSGRVQTGIPGSLMAAQISPLPDAAEGHQDAVPRLDVVRFIGPEEFAASYTLASADDRVRFGVQQ